jgi:hypothetical protein
MSISDLPHLCPPYEHEKSNPYDPLSDDDEQVEGGIVGGKFVALIVLQDTSDYFQKIQLIRYCTIQLHLRTSSERLSWYRHQKVLL